MPHMTRPLTAIGPHCVPAVNTVDTHNNAVMSKMISPIALTLVAAQKVRQLRICHSDLVDVSIGRV